MSPHKFPSHQRFRSLIIPTRIWKSILPAQIEASRQQTEQRQAADRAQGVNTCTPTEHAKRVHKHPTELGAGLGTVLGATVAGWSWKPLNGVWDVDADRQPGVLVKSLFFFFFRAEVHNRSLRVHVLTILQWARGKVKKCKSRGAAEFILVGIKRLDGAWTGFNFGGYFYICFPSLPYIVARKKLAKNFTPNI